MATNRAAPEDLDEELAIILTNSFLPLWNHNWFQGISAPLERIPQRSSIAASSTPIAQLTPLQKSRRSFYWFVIKLTRLIGGDVSIATVPSPKDPSSELVAAILLFCPPYKRNASSFGPAFIRDLVTMYKADIFAVIRNYGLGGFQRVTDVFETNVQRMFKESLTPLGLKSEECGFVQMVSMNTDPDFDEALKGKGFARQLLQWRVERHFAECKDVKTGTGGKVTPVILDTTTDQGIRSYEKIGFELVNHFKPDTGTDADGFKLKKGLTKEEKQKLTAEAKEKCVMSIMFKMPPDTASEA